MCNGMVKVMDAETRELKRWETARGKPVAIMEKGSLVLTKLGKQLDYKVSGYAVERRSYARPEEGYYRHD